jgi:hypothetical protein
MANIGGKVLFKTMALKLLIAPALVYKRSLKTHLE